MKNFSDLLDIDMPLDVVIGVRAIADNGEPRCRISVNQSTLHDRPVSNFFQITTKIALRDSILIEIEMSGKEYSAQKETALVIESIQIDNHEMIPRFTHLARYRNEKNYGGPTSYLGFNGTWTLDIDIPFYRWRHRVTGQGWLLEPITGFRD